MVALRQSRRVAVLNVSPEFLVSMLKEGAHTKVSCQGLPVDAMVISSSYDPARNVFRIAILSESFPEVQDGDPLPSYPPPQFEAVPP